MESLNLNSPSLSKIISTNKMISEVFDLDKKKTLNEERWGEVVPPREKPKKNDSARSHSPKGGWPRENMTDVQKSNHLKYLENKEKIERENPSSVASFLPAEIGKEIVTTFTDPVEAGTLAASAALIAAPIPGSETAGAALNAWRMGRRLKTGVKAATGLVGAATADKLLRIPSDAAPVAPPAPAIPTHPDLPLPMPPETAAEQAANAAAAAAAAAAATTGGGGGGGGGSNGEPPKWWERGKVVRPLMRGAWKHRYPLIGTGALGAGAAATEYLRRAGNAAEGVEGTERLINQNNPSTRPDRWNNGSSDNTNRHAGTKRSQQDRNR